MNEEIEKLAREYVAHDERGAASAPDAWYVERIRVRAMVTAWHPEANALFWRRVQELRR